MGGIGLGHQSTRSIDQNNKLNVNRENVNLGVLNGKFKIPKLPLLQRSLSKGPENTQMIDDKTNLKSNRSNLMLKVPPEQNKGESTKEETVPKTSNSAVLRQIQKKNIKLAKIRSQSNILDIENGQNEKI